MLASRMGRGVYISGDQVHDMIVNGQVEPDGEPTDEAERQIELVERNLSLLARPFADAGFVPVLDWVVRDRRDLQVYIQGLSGLLLHVAVLAPSADAVKLLHVAVLAPSADAVKRRRPHEGDRWAHLTGRLTEELRDVGLRLDSTDLAPDETVARILAEKSSALLSPG